MWSACELVAVLGAAIRWPACASGAAAAAAPCDADAGVGEEAGTTFVRAQAVHTTSRATQAAHGLRRMTVRVTKGGEEGNGGSRYHKHNAIGGRTAGSTARFGSPSPLDQLARIPPRLLPTTARAHIPLARLAVRARERGRLARPT